MFSFEPFTKSFVKLHAIYRLGSSLDLCIKLKYGLWTLADLGVTHPMQPPNQNWGYYFIFLDKKFAPFARGRTNKQLSKF